MQCHLAKLEAENALKPSRMQFSGASPSVSRQRLFSLWPRGGMIALLPDWFISVHGSLWLSVRGSSPALEACRRRRRVRPARDTISPKTWLTLRRACPWLRPGRLRRGGGTPRRRETDPILIHKPRFPPALRLPQRAPLPRAWDPRPAPSPRGAVASPRNGRGEWEFDRHGPEMRQGTRVPGRPVQQPPRLEAHPPALTTWRH